MTKARWENRHEQRHTQTEHEWDGRSDGDGRNRPQMASDDANDSQATGGDITKYRALVARFSYPQDRPDLKFASMQVCCTMASPSVLDMQRVKRIGRYSAGKPRTVCLFRWQKEGAYSDTDWGGDRITRGVVMRGGHSLEVWTT